MKITNYFSITFSLAALLISYHTSYTRTKMGTHDVGHLTVAHRLDTPNAGSLTSKSVPKEAVIADLASLEKNFIKLMKSVAVLEKRINGYDSHRLNNPSEINQGDDFEYPLATNEDAIAVSEQEEYDFQNRINLIDTRFQTEDFDAYWSIQMNGTITEAFANEQLSMCHLVEVDCRTNICRVQVQLDVGESIDNIFLGLLPIVSDELPGAVVHDEDKGYEDKDTVIYFARKGYDLP